MFNPWEGWLVQIASGGLVKELDSSSWLIKMLVGWFLQLVVYCSFGRFPSDIHSCNYWIS